MKKLKVLVIVFVCLVELVGCVPKNNDVDSGAIPPMLVMNNEYYVIRGIPITKLPENYECMGEITEKEANDTGLQGCKYYANKFISSFDEFYVYQECGTPIDENTVDPMQRQWAYVKWVREGFYNNETEIEGSSQFMIDSVTSVYIRNIFTGESACISENKDIQKILGVLSVDSWNIESLTNCAGNIEIMIDGTTYMYHSDCGTFNDFTNQRYLSPDDETINMVNILFAKYVSLTTTEVPAE